MGASYADIILDELDFKQAQMEKSDTGRENGQGENGEVYGLSSSGER